ncbi:MAG: hypothetical protein QM696_10540 [Steroidobacteraceae bacterium]
MVLAMIVALAMGPTVMAAQQVGGTRPINKAPPGSQPPSADPRDFNGVWWKSFTPVLKQIDGSDVPFKPHAKAIQDAYDEAARVGKPMMDAATQCMPHGVPRSMLAPYPIQIIQTPGQMTILHEASHNLRLIYMDVPHSKHLKSTFMGESVAHWEGDTLVVSTTGFNTLTMMDRGGSTHSEKLRVTERMRKISNGTQLEVVYDFDDPETYTHPWSTRIVFEWRPDVKILEAVCEENNQDATDAIPGTEGAKP